MDPDGKIKIELKNCVYDGCGKLAGFLRKSTASWTRFAQNFRKMVGGLIIIHLYKIIYKRIRGSTDGTTAEIL